MWAGGALRLASKSLRPFSRLWESSLPAVRSFSSASPPLHRLQTRIGADARPAPPEGRDASARRSDDGFEEVREDDSHWLPRVAFFLETQNDEALTSLSKAARGDVFSCDSRERIELQALRAAKKAGFVFPEVTVALLYSPGSAASQRSREWLLDGLKSLFGEGSSPEGGGAVEMVALQGPCASRLLRVFGVSSLPHCLLFSKGRLVQEIHAGASESQRRRFLQAALATARLGSGEGISGDSKISSVAARPRDCTVVEELKKELYGERRADRLEALLRELLKLGPWGRPPYERISQEPPHGKSKGSGRRAQVHKTLARQKPFEGKHGETEKSKAAVPSGEYLLDSDVGASRWAALGLASLFDAPSLSSQALRLLQEELQGLLEDSSRRSKRERGAPSEGEAREAFEAEAFFEGLSSPALRSAALALAGSPEPLWSLDDFPLQRELPLRNAMVLNASLSSKALTTLKGKGPNRCSFAAEEFHRNLLARARRCLAARLFLEALLGSEAFRKGDEEAAPPPLATEALALAENAHVEWVRGAVKAGRISPASLGRRPLHASLRSSQDGLLDRASPSAASQREGGEGEGGCVNSLDWISEPRVPSPGRALLGCMYTALGCGRVNAGPEKLAVHQSLARLDVEMGAADFVPAVFRHTNARRGGKPQMMRGRSGKWLWRGPYWKPPWTRKKKWIPEDWHLTNPTA